MNKYLILLIFSSLSASLLASSGAGNGGDAIVCEDSVTLLDSYEAQKRHWILDLGESEDIRSQVNYVIHKLESKDIHTSRRLHQYAMEMVDDLEFLARNPSERGRVLYLGNDIIAEIDDSFEVTLPAGCSKQQMVSQREPRFSMEYRYQINKGLWDRLSSVDKAMTVLHESWYRIMIEQGATNSIATRYFNGLVASNQFESMSFQDYIRDLRNTELKQYHIVNNSSVIYQSEIRIDLTNEQAIRFTPEDMACVSEISFNTNLKRRRRRRDITFPEMCFQNSHVRTLELPHSLVRRRLIRQSINIVLDHWYVRISGATDEKAMLYFHPNGRYQKASGVNIPFIVQMWYDCGDGRKSYQRRANCSGPYWDSGRRFNIYGPLEFDQNELPMGEEFGVNTARTENSAHGSATQNGYGVQQEQRQRPGREQQQQQQQQG